jgi:hypothetical protein
MQQTDTCKCQDLWHQATSPSNKRFFRTAKRKPMWTSKPSEMWHCTTAWMIPTFWGSHSAFFLYCLTFWEKALKSFGTLASTCVETRHHIPNTSLFQQQSSKDLKSHKMVGTFKVTVSWVVTMWPTFWRNSPPKQYLSTRLCGIIYKKTVMFIVTTVRISNLASYSVASDSQLTQFPSSSTNMHAEVQFHFTSVMRHECWSGRSVKIKCPRTWKN